MATIVTAYLVAPILNWVGFTAAGPAAGTWAAAWMSSVATAAGGAVPAGMYCFVETCVQLY